MHDREEISFGIIPLHRSHQQWEVLLVLHKNAHHWGFPKGKGENHEKPLESAKRELQEETGLRVEYLLQEEPFFEEYSYYRGGEKILKRVHYFPAVVTGDLVLQPEEVADGKWFLLDKAYSQLTFDEAKRICMKVEKIYCQ